MNRILVAYATMAGSTAEVAQAVGEEIAKSGLQVDALPLSQISDLAAYDGVVALLAGNQPTPPTRCNSSKVPFCG